jgi:hypothetical protein
MRRSVGCVHRLTGAKSVTARDEPLDPDLRRELHDLPTQLPQRNSKSDAETSVAPTDSAATAKNPSS